MRKSALCPHDLRAGLIRFQRCLGEGSRFGTINKANDYSNKRRLRCSTRNSKLKEFQAMESRLAAAQTRRRCCGRPRHTDFSDENFAKILVVLRGLTLPE
jgi:hypothetical protein